MSRTYKCECCGGEFETGWSEEEAAAEFHENHPGADISDASTVCDGCYQEFQEWLRSTEGMSKQ